MSTTGVSFQAVWVAPSLILAMGISRLCTDAVMLFRARSKSTVPIDRIPLVWAACIFIQQIQYIRGVVDLSAEQRTWSLLDFLLFLSLSIALYIVASLVLPEAVQGDAETEPTPVFERDAGRCWACRTGASAGSWSTGASLACRWSPFPVRCSSYWGWCR